MHKPKKKDVPAAAAPAGYGYAAKRQSHAVATAAAAAAAAAANTDAASSGRHRQQHRQQQPLTSSSRGSRSGSAPKMSLGQRRSSSAASHGEPETVAAAASPHHHHPPALPLHAVPLSTVVSAKPSAKLSAVERTVTELDELPAEHRRRTTTLFVSCNLLCTLRGVEQFEALSVLSAGSNSLASLESLAPLARLRQLHTLNLQNNVVTQLPHYRAHVLHLCPSLRSLDSKPVTARERAAAGDTLLREQAQLVDMYANELLLARLRAAVARVTLHRDFRACVGGGAAADAASGGVGVPSCVSLEKLLCSAADVLVWRQPFAEALPLLRLRVRRARLVRIAAQHNERSMDSRVGWDAAYRGVLEAQAAAADEEAAALREAAAAAFGVAAERLADPTLLETFKRLVQMLSEKYERGELLPGWPTHAPPPQETTEAEELAAAAAAAAAASSRRPSPSAASGAATSPASLPPQQADPGTPPLEEEEAAALAGGGRGRERSRSSGSGGVDGNDNGACGYADDDAAAALTLQQLQVLDGRQERAAAKRRRRASSSAAAAAAAAARAVAASTAAAAADEAIASVQELLEEAGSVEGVATAASVSSLRSSGQALSFATTAATAGGGGGGGARSEASTMAAAAAASVADEMKLQQVNEALRQRLEQYQRSHEKTAAAAKQYKALMREAQKAEAAERQRADANGREVEALRTALAEAERRQRGGGGAAAAAASAASVAAAEAEANRRVDALTKELEEVHECVLELEQENYTLQQKLTQARNEGRLAAHEARKEEEERPAAVEGNADDGDSAADDDDDEAVAELGRRARLRRSFAALRGAAARQRAASALAAGAERRRLLRGSLRAWGARARRSAFVSAGLARHRAEELDTAAAAMKHWHGVARSGVLGRRRQAREDEGRRRVEEACRSAAAAAASSSSSSSPDRSTPVLRRRPRRVAAEAAAAAAASEDAAEAATVGRRGIFGGGCGTPASSGSSRSPEQRTAAAAVPTPAAPRLRKVSHRHSGPLRAAALCSSSSDGEAARAGAVVAAAQAAHSARHDRRVHAALQAMRHYVLRLKRVAFSSWRRAAATEAAERRLSAARWFHRWAAAPAAAAERRRATAATLEGVAEAVLRRRERRVLQGALRQWAEAGRKAGLLGRLEELCVEKAEKGRLQRRFAAWRAAGWARRVRAQEERERQGDAVRLEKEVEQQRAKVSSLGLANVRLVESLSEAVRKSSQLEVDLEAKKTALRDMANTAGHFKASTRVLETQLKTAKSTKMVDKVKMNALLQEALKGAEELADQQTRQLLIEATSSQRIQELAAELQDAKGGLHALNSRLTVAQDQLEQAHENGATTTTAMSNLAGQLRDKVREQEGLIATLEVERLQHESVQDSCKKDLLSAQRRLCETEQQRDLALHQHAQLRVLERVGASHPPPPPPPPPQHPPVASAAAACAFDEMERLKREVQALEEREWGVGGAGPADSTDAAAPAAAAAAAAAATATAPRGHGSPATSASSATSSSSASPQQQQQQQQPLPPPAHAVHQRASTDQPDEDNGLTDTSPLYGSPAASSAAALQQQIARASVSVRASAAAAVPQPSHAGADTSGEVEELLKRARRAKEQLCEREAKLRRHSAEVLLRGSVSPPSDGEQTTSSEDF